MAEGGLGRAQCALAPDAGMGVHQREGGVVADGAEIAEMIGDALDLGHQRAQPCRARRRRGAERGLDRAGIGEGVSDGQIAADAADEPRPGLDGRAAHQPLNSLVQVAEAFFEPHDRFAAGVEAEMAGLDDPGMDGADRNLMQGWPLGRAELVRRLRRLARLRAPQRRLDLPAAVIEPGASVLCALRPQAVQIGERALQPDRGGMDRRQPRETPRPGRRDAAPEPRARRARGRPRRRRPRDRPAAPRPPRAAASPLSNRQMWRSCFPSRERGSAAPLKSRRRALACAA